MVAIMSLPIERLAALFALAYVGLFVGLIAFTTNGPDAMLQPADEMARAVSEGTAMRARRSSGSRRASRSPGSRPVSPSCSCGEGTRAEPRSRQWQEVSSLRSTRCQRLR